MLARKLATMFVASVLVGVSLVAQAFSAGPWGQAVDIELAPPGAQADFNTPTSLDGCPFISRDGKSFYMASDRPGGLGGLDIWVSIRKHQSDPWGGR